MALQPKQVEEVNKIIAEIEAAIKPKQEIGAQSKSVLKGLLAAHKVKKEPVFFKCRREYSDQIVAHFVTEKKLVRNKFHAKVQEHIFLL